ncbi:hypothetical protein BS1321_02765 [Peribacillus simplex NBRC 15720 = DSM 1321]|uniref:Uncharacterized protein n=1 Tax=Peribacillus simplex NBRC 15720 = DSM 1321 TaxID=1349754 RepID=A0A223ECL3_9BACI|nr:hypothetical protein BS1321_02765 [Peribacillus simplex NBRC 15720 = DSM 1321]
MKRKIHLAHFVMEKMLNYIHLLVLHSLLGNTIAKIVKLYLKVYVGKVLLLLFNLMKTKW